MPTNRSQVMRFSRELSEHTEWFTAKWVAEGPPPTNVEHYFPSAARLKAWLVTEQHYSEAEADALIAHLRGHTDTTA
jgi:hypothetical protein